MRGSLATRLLARIDRTPGGCWIWTGSLRQGYGQIWSSVDPAGRRQLLATHRVSFEITKGPIPAGLDLDHLCRNTRCVNPDHLEPVTRRENLIRGLEARGRRRAPRPRPVVECAYCSSSFVYVGRGRPRRFCSDACRFRFHNERRVAP